MGTKKDKTDGTTTSSSGTKKKSSSSSSKTSTSTVNKSSSSNSSSKKKSSSSSSSKSSTTKESSNNNQINNNKKQQQDDDEDFEEKQFILRVPEDIADRIRQKLKSHTSKSSDKAQRVDLQMNLKFGDDLDILSFLQNARLQEEDLKIKRPEDISGYLSDIEYGIDKNRKGRFQIDNEILPCTLVDLPCHTEAYKSIDCQTYYKCGDVSQMIIVQKPSELDKDIQKSRLRRSRYYQQRSSSSKYRTIKRKSKDLVQTYTFEDGITPPTERILRHWNNQKLAVSRKDIRKMKEKYIQMLEEEDPNKVKIEILEYTSEQERLAAEEESSESSDSEAGSDSDEDSDESDIFDELNKQQDTLESISQQGNNAGMVPPQHQQGLTRSSSSQMMLEDVSSNASTTPVSIASSVTTPAPMSATSTNTNFIQFPSNVNNNTKNINNTMNAAGRKVTFASPPPGPGNTNQSLVPISNNSALMDESESDDEMSDEEDEVPTTTQQKQTNNMPLHINTSRTSTPMTTPSSTTPTSSATPSSMPTFAPSQAFIDVPPVSNEQPPLANTNNITTNASTGQQQIPTQQIFEEDTQSSEESEEGEDEDEEMFDINAPSQQTNVDVTSSAEYQSLLQQKAKIESEMQALGSQIASIRDSMSRAKNDIQRQRIQSNLSNFENRLQSKQDEISNVENQISAMVQQSSASSSSNVPPF
ncbi:hypothetical protein ABK040_004093 [Willaertia magna]